MNPNAMPSVMLNVRGIITSIKNAGSASVKSSHSMSRTDFIIKLPTTINAGDVTGYSVNVLAADPEL
jgi:hypothetical protein